MSLYSLSIILVLALSLYGHLRIYNSLNTPCLPTHFSVQVFAGRYKSPLPATGQIHPPNLLTCTPNLVYLSSVVLISKPIEIELHPSFPPKVESCLRICALYLCLYPYHQAKHLLHNKGSDFSRLRDLKQHPGWGGDTVKAGDSAADGRQRGREGHAALFVTEIHRIPTALHRQEMTFYSLYTHSLNKYLLNINSAWDAVRQN